MTMFDGAKLSMLVFLSTGGRHLSAVRGDMAVMGSWFDQASMRSLLVGLARSNAADPVRSTCQRKDTMVDRKKGQTDTSSGTDEHPKERTPARRYSQS